MVDLLARAGTEVASWHPDQPFPEEPVTFLGLHQPEQLRGIDGHHRGPAQRIDPRLTLPVQWTREAMTGLPSRTL
ncbi:hypothetical protein ACFQV2_20005 [Actinokineospora soli]|uniref:Uncharacterized protein n=1 Tax=Actinokineospora soli TaxID=1048753 RepID=A0ABW2TRL8_9PSEU